MTADDVEPLFEVLGNVEVARWLRAAGQEGAFTRAECEAFLASNPLRIERV